MKKLSKTSWFNKNFWFATELKDVMKLLDFFIKEKSNLLEIMRMLLIKVIIYYFIVHSAHI